MNYKHIFPITLASILASFINFTPLVFGEHLKFTFFDMFGPITGIIPAALTAITSFIIKGNFGLAAILHIFPILFGAWYFATNKKIVNLAPLLAMAAFVINPVSRETWYYCLFWLVPILCQPFKQTSLLAKSLGATFTAHAVGGLLWIYAFNPPAAVWQNLIPVVIMERIIFTLTAIIVYRIVKEVPRWIRSFGLIRNS